MDSTVGTIFDIRRFSVHDGEGLRSTVFLKGCPLQCLWCQNPEGLAFESRLMWFEQRCIRCRSCIDGAQPEFPHLLSWEKDKLLINYAAVPAPSALHTLMDLCPACALTWDSRKVTAAELVLELERDRVFFRYGGGITLSGGEPLAQPEFALAVLESCRTAGLHTAIETSLFAPLETVEAAAELSDRIIADCKIFDAERHRHATGQDNTLILENIARLLAGHHASKVLIRTPLIPGFTATEENIGAISRFISSFGETAYELLNYNPLGAAKYGLTGKTYFFTENIENPKPYTKKELRWFKDIALRNGIKNIKE